MDDNRDDKDFNELFRTVLENAEAEPSPGLDVKLMNRLGRKEFLHFIPRKFNIYYAGGLVAAAAIIISQVLQLRTNELIPEGSVSDTLIIEQPAAVKSTPDNIVPGVKGIKQDGREVVPGEISKETPSPVAKGRQDAKELVRESIPPAEGTISRGRPANITAADQTLKGTLNSQTDLIKASLTEGCVPLKVSFSIKGLSPDSCKWNFGDGGSSVSQAADWLFDIDGEYKVDLTVYRSGRPSFSSLTVTVHPRPEARFEIHPDKARLPQDEISFLNYSAGGADFIWDFGDGNKSDLFEPKHRYSRFDNYNVSLTAISSEGCSDTLLIRNAFGGSSYFISFPNAFIPNPNGPSGGYYSQATDESASVFHPSYAGISEYQLRIFTRRGILIFESNDVNIGWDGYYKGQLSDPGIYIYKVRGSYINGEPFTMGGDIMLIKN